MTLEFLQTERKVPTTVPFLDVPSWELAAGRAAPTAPHFNQRFAADVMPMPTTGFMKTFPEYAVIEPNAIVRGIDALTKAPEVGLGVFDQLFGGLPGRAAGAAAGAIAPHIPEPVKKASDSVAGGLEGAMEWLVEPWARRIGNVFNPDPRPRSLLGEGDKASFFGGEDLAQDLTDAVRMVATGLMLLRAPGLASKALHSAKLGVVPDAVGGYAYSFANTVGRRSFIAESTAAKFGRMAGLTTQALGGVGLAAEATLPHVAGDEKWAQDILNTRVVPEDSAWRFPFELAVSLPMDLPSWLLAAKGARVTAKAAEKVFGPGRNVQAHLLKDSEGYVSRGLTTTDELDALHTHSVVQYSKQTLLDDYKNTTPGVELSEIGQLPQVAGRAKARGITEQEAANQLVSERIAELYRTSGTDKLHRRAAQHAEERFNWQGLSDADRLQQWHDYYETVLPFERDFPDLVLSVNETKQVLQHGAALAWLKKQERWGSVERTQFEARFPAFSKTIDGKSVNLARQMSKDKLITELEGIKGPKGVLASAGARIGSLQADLDRINSLIQKGDKTLRPERARVHAEIEAARAEAVAEFTKKAATYEKALAAAEVSLMKLTTTAADDRAAIALKMEKLEKKLSDARIAARDARLAGKRWTLEKFGDTARMRLVDDLGVRISRAERTGPGKAWDRVFGALPNRQLAMQAEDFLYERAGEVGLDPHKVDVLMAKLSKRLDVDNSGYFLGFRRTKYASIYNLDPHVIDDFAKEAGITVAPKGMKSWAEAFYRAYPGPTRILQEALTGRHWKAPYVQSFVHLHRTLYPQFRFYFSPRFVAVNLAERNILGTALGGRKFRFDREFDPRMTRLGGTTTRYESAANTSFVEVDALPEELGHLAGLLTPQYQARMFVKALQKDPRMADALATMGVNAENIGEVTKFVDDVLKDRMKLADFQVPLTKAEQEVKTRIDELLKKQSPNMGLELADRKELEQLHKDLLASVVRRHIAQEGTKFNEAAREAASAAAAAKPGAARNDALSKVLGKKPGAMTLSADEVAKAYEQAKLAYSDAITNGGVTRSIRGEVPQTGFAASPYKPRETVLSRAATAEDYRVFTRKNLDLLSEPDHYIGGWTDSATGKTYLDVTVVKSSREEAIRLAQANDQRAIYDIAGRQDIAVPAGAKASAGPAAADAGANGGSNTALRAGVSDAERGEVTQELLNTLSRANYRALDDARAIFLGNPERSALERGLNSYLLYWPISYQLKVGRQLFKFLTGKAFNLPTGSAPATAWAHLYEEVQGHVEAQDEIGQWFTGHKQALFLLEQFIPMTPSSVGATLSPFTRFAGSVAGLGQDPNPKKLFDRITSQGLGYDATLFWRVIEEMRKSLPKD